MEYRQLPHGKQGEKFSVLGLGLGGIGTTLPDEIEAIIRKAGKPHGTDRRLFRITGLFRRGDSRIARTALAKCIRACCRVLQHAQFRLQAKFDRLGVFTTFFIFYVL